MGIYCSCGLIRYAAFFLDFLSGFTNAEYHIAIVDFIFSSRGRKRNRRLAYGFCSGFTSGEYHVIRVDFIFSSRGRLKRDRGFANPLSLSNTSPDPFGDPLRRGISAAAGLGQYRIPVSGAIAYHHFDVRIGCFVFGFVSFAFQMVLFGLYRTFFIIGGKKTLFVYPFLLVFGITADRDYCFNFVGCKSISPIRLGRTIL